MNLSVANQAEFNRTLEQYARLSKKTLAEVVNRKARDVAIKAMQLTEKANKQTVAKVAESDWWPKYVAKVIAESAQGIRISLAGKRKVETFKFAKGREVARYTTKAGKIKAFANVRGDYTAEEAKLVSKRLIASRLRAIAFLVSGWLASTRKLNLAIGDTRGPDRGRKSFGKATPATLLGWSPQAVCENNAVTHAGATTPRPSGAIKVLEKGLSQALAVVSADMAQYVARKLGETTKQAGIKTT